MLATLLPGVREVRAPLVAGYLWLLAFWIFLEPHFHAHPQHTELYDSLARLGDLMSPVGIAIVVSVAAYLTGALVEGVLQPLRRRFMYSKFVSRRMLRYRRLRPWRPGRPSDVGLLLSNQAVMDAERRLMDVRLDPRDLLGSDATFELQAAIEGEWSLIATRLMGESPELFAAYDRLKAEAELRFAVTMSLPLVLAAASFRSSAWWLLGLVLLIPLLIDGVARARQGDDVLADALLIGTVEAPSVERMRRRVDERVALELS